MEHNQRILELTVLIKNLQLSAVIDSVFSHVTQIVSSQRNNTPRPAKKLGTSQKSSDKAINITDKLMACQLEKLRSRSTKTLKYNTDEGIKLETRNNNTAVVSTGNEVSTKFEAANVNDNGKMAIKRSLSEDDSDHSGNDNGKVSIKGSLSEDDRDYSGDTMEYSSDTDNYPDFEMNKKKAKKPTLKEASLDFPSTPKDKATPNTFPKAHLLKAKCGFCGMISNYDVTRRHTYEQHFEEIMNQGKPSLKECLKIKCMLCKDEVVREDYSIHVLLKHPAPVEKKTNRGRYFKMKVGCLFCDVIVRNVFYMDHLKDAHPEKAEVFTSNASMKKRDGVKFERAKPGALNAASHLLPMICVYCENPREIICDQYKPHILECHPNFADKNVSNVIPGKVTLDVASEKAKYLFVDRSRHLPEKPPPPELYVCNLCGQSCTSRSSFFDHGRESHGFKTVHCCNYCHKFCKNSFERNNHEDDEHAIEKYLCETCGKDFVRSSSLKIHKENVHLGQIQKCVLFKKKAPRKENVLCNHCGKSFTRTSILKEHMLTKHSRIKSFKCDKCDKAFFSRKSLQKHAIIHADVKRYACKFCSYKTNRRDLLLSHLRIHTGEKPFRCSFCGTRFRIALSLRWHLENVHSVKLTEFQQFFQSETNGLSEASQILEDMYGDSDEEVKFQGGPLSSTCVGQKRKRQKQLTEDMERKGVSPLELSHHVPHAPHDQDKTEQKQEAGKSFPLGKKQLGNSPLLEYPSSEEAQFHTSRSRLEVINEPNLMYDEGTSGSQNASENEQGSCIYPGGFQQPYHFYH